jgi:hypothetical protein
MTNNKRIPEGKIDIYRKLYEHTQGGIFRKTTREKLLTKQGISGRGQPVNTFWYRQRENVKTALLDLELFIESADKDQVNQVLTRQTLRPILSRLFSRPSVAEPDTIRSDIADLFIQESFDYLKGQIERMTLSHDRTVNEATDLSSYFLQIISKGEKDGFWTN